MSYYESIKNNSKRYLSHVPSQGMTHQYDYTKILIGTSIMELLAVIADELHEKNQKSEAEPKWIPVSERLPKQGQEVICQCRASIIKVLKLDANGDWYQDANHCYMSGFVIAWMPLPKPYERKEK